MNNIKEFNKLNSNKVTRKSVRLGLFFEELRKVSVAQIQLSMYVINRGQICLTPECQSFEELSEDIDRVIAELESVRELARQQFAKATKKNNRRSPAGDN